MSLFHGGLSTLVSLLCSCVSAGFDTAVVHNPSIHAFVTQLCELQRNFELLDWFGHNMCVPADWQHLYWQLR